ncbi:MAG: endonuclease [Candidatus Eisenbacteria bacterium]
MRKFPVPFVAAMLAACLAASPARSGVFLSELCDPQNNYQTDRFIEIYNSGPDTVSLASWKIIAVANNVDVNTWTLSGTLAPGQAKVAGSTAPVTSFPIHFASSTWLSTYGNWNGKVGDGAKLVNPSNAVIDLIVAPGDLFENKDLVRNASVTGPNPVYTASEWTATPVLLATDASPGSHNGSAPPAGGPVITNIVTDPASPTSGVPVDVQASVVDTSGAIDAVTLSWGSSAGSLPNVIGMTVLSGDTYRTSAQIPGQSSGASIYYQVQAVGATAPSQSAVLSYTIPGGGVGVPPSVLAVGEMSDSTFLVFFSEPVEQSSAEVPGNYTIGALAGVTAQRDPVKTSQVEVTIRSVSPGTRTLTVNGVADLEGNFAYGATRSFNYVDVTIPAGYYNSATGLIGSALRIALHNIIKNHTVGSYSGALTAFQTTDVKPNGKVWDMYSDIPGGTPPYEYSFGQTGQGATEGLGYNREHSWPQSWFGGSLPMYSDLWILYPTDAKVNGYRANYVYGKVATATTTSLNGSKLGSSATAGYAGTVFEPIDAYKGDLARGQFYVATRYYNEDQGWPGSPSATGAELVPWAVAQYSAWSQGDPVSWKERMRNGAAFVIQHNRNPFVDHPEFVAMIYDSLSFVGVGDTGRGWTLRLRANAPNPFGARTSITFDLAQPEYVSMRVYDVSGRLVRTLVARGPMDAGSHSAEWNGRDDDGAQVAAGLYFYRLEAGDAQETRRMVFVR